MKIQQYDKALDDAIKARLLNPKWPKVEILFIFTESFVLASYFNVTFCGFSVLINILIIYTSAKYKMTSLSWYISERLPFFFFFWSVLSMCKFNSFPVCVKFKFFFSVPLDK